MPLLGDKTIFEVIDEVCELYKYVFVKLPINLKVDLDVYKVKHYKKMILIYKVCPEKDKIVLKEPIEDEPKELSIKENPTEKYKYILSQRKAYVEWVNREFYDKLMLNIDSDMYKNYQKFVKGYLSLDTPYRGLLVYHGLGTGKTATAISLAEGLSGQMKIKIGNSMTVPVIELLMIHLFTALDWIPPDGLADQHI
jgi:hypothetical protein